MVPAVSSEFLLYIYCSIWFCEAKLSLKIMTFTLILTVFLLPIVRKISC